MKTLSDEIIENNMIDSGFIPTCEVKEFIKTIKKRINELSRDKDKIEQVFEGIASIIDEATGEEIRIF